jgi:hypothetical protein
LFVFFNPVYLDDSHNNQQGGMSGEGKFKVDYFSYLWLKMVNFQNSKALNLLKKSEKWKREICLKIYCIKTFLRKM